MSAEDRIRRLEDIEATRALLARYAAAADAASIVDMLPLFTEDAVLQTPRGDYNGSSGVERFFTEAWASDPSRKTHFVTNILPSWVRDSVVDANAYVLYVARAVGSSVIGWGRYDITTRVDDGTAKFCRFRLEMNMVTEIDKGWPLRDKGTTHVGE
jgi:hypothetical protein